MMNYSNKKVFLSLEYNPLKVINSAFIFGCMENGVKILLAMLGIIIVSAVFLIQPTSQALNIPPTPAISRINTTADDITSDTYKQSVNFVAGSGMTIIGDNSTKTITFSSSGGNGTSNPTYDTIENIGIGQASIYAGNTTNTNFSFKTLLEGQNVDFVNGTDEITINALGWQNNTDSNVGTGIGVFQTQVGSDSRFHSLLSGEGISIEDIGNEIRINATGSSGGENNTASNFGTYGTGIFKDKNGFDLRFLKILSLDPLITIGSNSSNVTFDLDDNVLTTTNTKTITGKTFDTEGSGNILTSSGATTGDILVHDGTEYSEFDMGTANQTLSVKSDGTGLTWTRPTKGMALVGSAETIQGKTNIGTSFIDVYSTIFQTDVIEFDSTGYTQIKFIMYWDYIGVGTQQCQVAEIANNSNVLITTATFTADQDPLITSWTNIPSGLLNTDKTYEWQCKSTTGTDDPTAGGFALYAR